MRLNTMGMVHTLQLSTRATLGADLRLMTISFSLLSHRFFFQASGELKGNTLIVSVNGRDIRIPAAEPLYLSAVALDAANLHDLKIGQDTHLSIFDPSSLGRRTIRVTPVGREKVRMMGRDIDALKLEVEVSGARMNAWVDEAGRIIQESGLLGFLLKQVPRESAMNGLPLRASRDLTRLVSVPAGKPLDDPQRLSRLKIGVDAVTEALFMNGDRQIYTEGVLTIQRERLPDPTVLDVSGMHAELSEEPLIEANHPEIVNLSARITAGEDRPLAKARRLMSWVYENIEKRPVISVPSALETLKYRQGDCNEHAVLLAALARAAGIPAQVEVGLVYLNGRFYYHAWNVLYLGNWITADALMNQFPADVTHLRLMRGDLNRQVDLMGVIGKILLTILDAE